MWDEIPAKEFCASVRDGTHDSPKPVESGRFLITSRHIIGGQIDLSNAYLISNDDFDAINKRSKVDRWDVLISMIGTVGEPCLVREEPEFAIKNIGLFKTKGELDGKWLYYYLTSPQAQALIRQNSRGTTQAYVPLGALRDFPVRVPRDREVMRAITNVLGGLDEKIGLNRRTNQTLEAMAQAIFKSWFVDFDPVKAKVAAIQEGRDPLRAAMTAVSGKADAELDALPPEQYEQLATIAALFPEEMETVAVVEVPKGWALAALSTVCDLNANSWSAKTLPASVKYVDLANTKNGEVIEVQTLEGPHIPSRARRILEVGDTIVGTVRPGNRSFALVGEAGLTGSTGFAVLSPKESYLREYVYLAATVDANIERLAHLADGGAYPAVRPELVVSDALPIPPADLLREFHRISSCMLDHVMEVRRANKSLADLRDALLPKLLSGELSVEALAETAGAA